MRVLRGNTVKKPIFTTLQKKIKGIHEKSWPGKTIIFGRLEIQKGSVHFYSFKGVSTGERNIAFLS